MIVDELLLLGGGGSKALSRVDGVMTGSPVGVNPVGPGNKSILVEVGVVYEPKNMSMLANSSDVGGLGLLAVDVSLMRGSQYELLVLVRVSVAPPSFEI